MKKETCKLFLPHAIALGIILLLALGGYIFNSGFIGGMLGTIRGTVTDPTCLVVGFIAGVSSPHYKKFALIAFPLSIAVSVLIGYVVNIGLQSKGLPPTTIGMYVLPACSILIISHFINFFRVCFFMKSNQPKTKIEV